MKFYLNGNAVNVEVTPVITETLDESLDSASVTLEASSSPSPIAPHQSFVIDFENGTTLNFLTSSDQVSIFSLKPLTYKHTLGLIQTSKELSHHVIKNSVFSQPSNPVREARYCVTECLGEVRHINDDINYPYSQLEKLEHTGQRINFTKESHEKINKVYAEVQVWAVIKQAGNDTNGVMYKVHSLQELMTLTENVSIYSLNAPQISYTTSGGSVHSRNLTVYDEFFVKYEQPQSIVNLFNQYTIRPGFDGSIPINTGRIYPEDYKTPMFIIVNLVLSVETYYNTVYDVLNLIRQRQKQSRDGFAKDDLFTLPTDESNHDLYELLTKTIAPNFTFTQTTVYECLAEIFRLFDGIFVLKGDNKELDIEYLNERNTTPITKDLSGLNISITENERVNGMLSYYQNAKVNVLYPGKKSMGYVRSVEPGVPAASDHHFLVEKPIQTINKCEVEITSCRLPTFYPQGGNFMVITGDWNLDITRYVVDESLWSLLPKSDTFPYGGDYRNVVQNNSVYFAKGDNKIQIALTMQTRFNITYYCLYQAVKSAYFYMIGMDDSMNSSPNEPDITAPNFKGSWKDIKFRLNYVSTINGRSKIESPTFKYDGDTLISQSNGSVDLNKMGLNMLGVSLKTGEPVLNATHEISTWADRIKKGQILTFDSQEWVANICAYTILDETHFRGQISFTKNYNNLSSRIQVMREKRLSNISNELTIESEDNIIEYVHFSTRSASLLTNKEGASIRTNTFGKLLKNTFELDSSDRPSISTCIQFISSLDNVPSPSYTTWIGIRIPLVKYGLGNCICFEAKYSSPINAGNKTTTSSGWFGSNKYFTEIQKYTDDYGFLDNITLYYTDVTSDIHGPDIVWVTRTADDYQPDILISNLEIYKQPNEIFSLNYELCFLPQNANIDFVGSEFINNNYAITEDCSKSFVLYYTDSDDTFKYSIIDTKGHEGHTKNITSVTQALSDTNVIAITFNFNSIAGVNVWAICDEDGNIYFASNDDSDKNNTITSKTIYFSLSRNRT